MVDVTLLQINLEGAELTAHAPFSGADGKSISGSKFASKLGGASDSTLSLGSLGGSSAESDDSTAESDSGAETTDPVEIDIEDEEEPDPESSSRPLAPLLALVVFAILVVAIKKLRGGATDE